jgi:hypothetical protein
MANANFGSMIAVLDGCLVDGFNLRSVDSIVRTGSVVRVNISAGHGYLQNQIVEIAGATPAAYNGQWRVESVSASWFEFNITGTPTTPATGTITVKTAALGFQKPFSGTHKAAYRSPNILSSRPFLRVDNSTHPGWVTGRQIQGKVHMGLNMSDIDTFVGDFAPWNPSGTSFPDWGWYKWHQSHSSGNGQSTPNSASGATWVLIGNDRTFYFIVYCAGSFQAGRMYAFGDFVSYKPGDLFNSFLWATENFNESNTTANVINPCGPLGNQYGTPSTTVSGEIVLKSWTGVGGSARAFKASMIPAWGNANHPRSGTQTGVAWPNGPTQSMLLWPSYVWENQAHIRGVYPGLMCIGNNVNLSEVVGGQIVDNVVNYPGRRFMVVSTADMIQINTGGGGSNDGRVAFDITGPWF